MSVKSFQYNLDYFRKVNLPTSDLVIDSTN